MENAIKFFPDLVIPKAQHGNSLRCQKFLSRLVVFFAKAVAVASTIKFDGKLRGRTIKIQDVRIDRMLSPKFLTVKVSVPQTAPKSAFAVGRALAKITGAGH